MGVSIRPSDAREGGIFDPAVYRFTESKYLLYDYGGKGDTVTLAFSTKLVNVAKPSETHDQIWSIGDPQSFIPSDDGMEIIAVGKRDYLSKGCNFIQLTESLVNSGYPEDRLTGNAGNDFDGLEAFIDWHDVKERAGLESTRTDAQGNVRKRQIALVEKVEKLPWDNKAALTGNPAKGPAGGPPKGRTAAATSGPPKPAAAPAATPAAPADSGEIDLDSSPAVKLAGFLVAKASEASYTMAAVRTMLFREFGSDPERAAITTLSANRAVVEAICEANGITLDGDSISMG